MTAVPGGAVEVRSAGSAPADQVNRTAVAAMAEVGIDITAARPEVLTTDEDRAPADLRPRTSTASPEPVD